jgi:hypothetical protein
MATPDLLDTLIIRFSHAPFYQKLACGFSRTNAVSTDLYTARVGFIFFIPSTKLPTPNHTPFL